MEVSKKSEEIAQKNPNNHALCNSLATPVAVLKSVSPDELVEAITQAHTGRMYLSMEVSQVLVSSQPQKAIPLLTAREKEVLACIAKGLTNHETAEKLFVSPLTVDSHRKNLLAKFQVKNTAALIKLAVEQQLV